MPALDSLMEEHALIRATLTALEVYADQLERSTGADRVDLKRFAAFFMDFAELWHHGKEEDVLLPALARAGLAWDDGMLALVREDHEQENYLIRVISQAASQEGVFEPEDLRHALAAIRDFAQHQRLHLEREEKSLYPEVARRLTGAAREDLAREFADLEHQRFGHLDYEHCRQDARALIQRYPAPAPIAQDSPP